MVLATDSHGNELVALVLDETRSAAAPSAPLTGALVVVTGPDGVLLVHDVWRDQWEVAGGGIEAGESREQAAVREVAEESGQQLIGLRRVGRATFRLARDGRVEQADLFRGEVERAAPFHGNEETDAICWWDGVSPVSGLGAIDAELIRQVLDTGRR